MTTSTIQGVPVDPTPPAEGEALVLTGGVYTPTPVGGGFSGVALTRVSTSAPILGLSSAVFAPISFDTEDIDQNSAWVVGSPSVFTIPSNGNYRVQFSAYAQIDAGLTVEFQIEIDRGGSPEVASDYLSSNSNLAYKWLTATFVRNMTAGDVVTMGYVRASGDGATSVRLFTGAFATLEKLS